MNPLEVMGVTLLAIFAPVALLGAWLAHRERRNPPVKPPVSQVRIIPPPPAPPPAPPCRRCRCQNR